ncbi:MAG: hypothetical protein IJ808_06800 [Muribaculaceae bacterium]|nr:hypothetical protein [Muribaculaceae bacterium]
MAQNQEFTKAIQDWLNLPDEQRDYSKGAMYLLKLSGNQIMYRNLMANPRRNADFIVRQLQKRLSFRLQQLTHAQVEEMQSQVNQIAVKVLTPNSGEKFKQGKRDDHDQLPDEIQALYVENLSIVQRMRELHLRLRTLSLDTAPCPDSDRYPFLKELIALDKKLHSNWGTYDRYTGTDGAATAEADAREASRNAVKLINLAKGRYAKKPSEELKKQILDLWSKVINPTDKLTNDLKELGILE